MCLPRVEEVDLPPVEVAVAPSAEAVDPPLAEAAVTLAEVAVAPPAGAVAPPAVVAVATPAVGAEALLAAAAAPAVPLLLLLHRSEEAVRGAARGDPTDAEVPAEVRLAVVTTGPRLAARLVMTPGAVTGRVVAAQRTTVVSVRRWREP